MHLVFGIAADGRAYPEHPGREQGAVDAAVVGPAGLLGIIAAQLGLGSPVTHNVQRIAAWQGKLATAGQTGSRFWSGSFSVDPWTSARHLLAWRDSLVEAGWTPHALSNPLGRLSDIAAAELMGPVLPSGRA